MEIIPVANQKGGVLKSTTALSISIDLSRRGKKVLLIDWDPQHSLSETFCSDEIREEKSIHKALLNMMDINDCIERISPALAFIPAAQELEQLPSQLISLGMANQYILLDALEELRDPFDQVVLDCPPNNSFINTLALSIADTVVIPTHKSNWTKAGTEYIIATIKDLKNQKRSSVRIKKVVLLPTAINRKKRYFFTDQEFKQFTDEIREQFEDDFIHVSDVTIPHSETACSLENATRAEICSNVPILKEYSEFTRLEVVNGK